MTATCDFCTNPFADPDDPAGICGKLAPYTVVCRRKADGHTETAHRCVAHCEETSPAWEVVEVLYGNDVAARARIAWLSADRRRLLDALGKASEEVFKLKPGALDGVQVIEMLAEAAKAPRAPAKRSVKEVADAAEAAAGSALVLGNVLAIASRAEAGQVEEKINESVHTVRTKLQEHFKCFAEVADAVGMRRVAQRARNQIDGLKLALESPMMRDCPAACRRAIADRAREVAEVWLTWALQVDP